jgi:hypothetical protein
MSKFQSIVSTLAAFASIAVTTVGVYKAVENTRQHSAAQQEQIDQLKEQLKQQKPQVPLQVQQTPGPAMLPPGNQPSPLITDSAQSPPPVPSLPSRP